MHLTARFASLSLVSQLRVELTRSNLRLAVGRDLLLRFVAAEIAFAAVQLLAGNLTMDVAAAILAFVIPNAVVREIGPRRVAAFENELAETLDLFVGSLRAGQALLLALESSSYEQAEPMCSELRRIVGQVDMCVSISDTMETVTARFDRRDIEPFAAAIAINWETGGNLTEVLERLVRTVRQRR